MININIYPWNSDVWRSLAERLVTGRLPHAVLLSGATGIGKRDLGRAIAASLLCESRLPDGVACGQCISCRLVTNRTHPDLQIVRPAVVALAEDGFESDETAADAGDSDGEGDSVSVAKDKKASRDITVDQVRAVGTFTQIAAHRGGSKVVLLYPADAMNAIAANALLKALEEPAPGVFFVLVSDRPYRLLPTIVSRCHRVSLAAPEESAALAWLRASGEFTVEQVRVLGGGAMRVKELAGSNYWDVRTLVVQALSQGADCDAMGAAKAIDLELKRIDRDAQQGIGATVDLGTVVGWMQRWLHDAIAARTAQTIRYHPQAIDALSELSKQSTERLLGFDDWLIGAARQCGHPVNQQLFLEDCLLRYRSLYERPAHAGLDQHDRERP